jgi:hypothetical protein
MSAKEGDRLQIIKELAKLIIKSPPALLQAGGLFSYRRSYCFGVSALIVSLLFDAAGRVATARLREDFATFTSFFARAVVAGVAFIFEDFIEDWLTLGHLEQSPAPLGQVEQSLPTAGQACDGVQRAQH